jgi:hypothetical protein
MAPRTQDIEVLTPMKGLQYHVPTTVMPKEGASNTDNIRLFNGVVQPAPGYENFGALNTVLGTPMLITEYVENDEDRHLLCFTTKYIYEYDTALGNWAKLTSNLKHLSTCDAIWTASANVTASVEGTIKVEGSGSAKLAIAAAFGTGLAGYIDFAAVDTSAMTYMHFWIRSSVTTASGDLRLAIDNTNACASPLTYYTVPALTADTWTQCEVAIGAGAAAGIVSIGLDVVNDLGAMNVYIDSVNATKPYTGNTTNRWSVAQHIDLFYATNGVDAIQRKDHSGEFLDWAEAVTATYKCRTLAAHADHLVMAYMIEAGVEYPQRVRWTDSGGEVFTGSAGSTETNGSDACVRLKPLGARLACYKENSIVMITAIGGSTVYRFDRPVTGRGILGIDYVTDYGDIHAVTMQDNVYLYDGGSDPKPIGDGIKDEFFRLLTSSAGNYGFMFYDTAVEEIHIFEPADGNTTASYDWVFQASLATWTRRSFTGINAIGTWKTNTSLTFGTASGTFGGASTTFGYRGLGASAPLILAGTSAGTIVQISELVYDNLGAAITKRFDSPDFTAARLAIKADQPVRYIDNRKRWMRMAYEAKGSSITIGYSSDDGQTWNTLKTQTLTNLYKRYFISFDISSEKIRFRFENSSVAGNFYLRWYSVSVIGASEV